MKDVAREAGVALGTVSKVVNGIPVGKSYQRAVEEANDRLGYYVNRQARALRSMESSFELEQSYMLMSGQHCASAPPCPPRPTSAVTGSSAPARMPGSPSTASA